MIGGTQLIKDNQIQLLGAKFQKISKKICVLKGFRME